MDENLKQFCTPRQLEYLQAVEQYGSNNKASKIIGVDRRTLDRALHSVQIKAARSGYSPKHDMTHTAPEGFNVKGVSTLYDQDGLPKAQWVKTTADKEQQALAMREVAQFVAEGMQQAKQIQAQVSGSNQPDPLVKLKEQELQIRAQSEQQDAQLDQQKLQLDAQNQQMRGEQFEKRLASQEQQTAARIDSAMQRELLKQRGK